MKIKQAISGFLAELQGATSDDVEIRHGVMMANESAWRAGGRVEAVITVQSTDALVKVVQWLNRHHQRWAIIGNTSNLLFVDQRIEGVLIKLGDRMASLKQLSAERLLVGAAAWVPGVARRAAWLQLSGIEHAIGIPGTFGGLVVMNGGSGGRCISESVSEVHAVNSSGERLLLDVRECGFARRKSVFQKGDCAITAVTLALKPGRPYRAVRRELLDTLRARRAKFPMRLPNCGSVFVSDPRTYAEFGPPGALIESCGLKGLSIGGAQISIQHANFIINQGGSAADILELIRIARAAVFERYGVDLRSEVKVVTSNCEILAADAFLKKD